MLSKVGFAPNLYIIPPVKIWSNRTTLELEHQFNNISIDITLTDSENYFGRW